MLELTLYRLIQLVRNLSVCMSFFKYERNAVVPKEFYSFLQKSIFPIDSPNGIPFGAKFEEKV